jgi:hypothetical protein
MELTFVRTFFTRSAMCVPGLLLFLVLGCGKVPGQFVIIQNQVPGENCSVSTSSSLYLPSGLLDVSLVRAEAPTAYLVFPLLENDLPGPGGGQTVDGNRIALSAFNVDLHLTSTDAPTEIADMFSGLETSHDPLVHFSIATSGSVASAGGHTAAIVESFPTGLATTLAPMLTPGMHVFVNIRVRALGNKLTGAVVSDDFDFPIQLCSGCLVASVQACPVSKVPARLGNPCNPAQDDPVDCCLIGGSLVCPSVVSQ